MTGKENALCFPEVFECGTMLSPREGNFRAWDGGGSRVDQAEWGFGDECSLLHIFYLISPVTSVSVQDVAGCLRGF